MRSKRLYCRLAWLIMSPFIFACEPVEERRPQGPENQDESAGIAAPAEPIPGPIGGDTAPFVPADEFPGIDPPPPPPAALGGMATEMLGGRPMSAGTPVPAEPAGGEPTDTCFGRENGVVLSVGAFGNCTYTDDCARTGTRTRTNRVCQNGLPLETIDTQILAECDRATDGVVIQNGLDGPCEYTDQCDEQGMKARTNRICDAGQVTEVVERRDFPTCVRETDDVVINTGEYSACAYSDPCSLFGVQSRTNLACINGRITEITETTETLDCRRETDGKVTAVGSFSECDYPNLCAEIGVRNRTNSVCQDGRVVPQLETDSTQCVRVTENTVVRPGVFGDCDGFDNVCDLTGIRSKIDQVCAGGTTEDQPAIAHCQRAQFGRTQTDASITSCVDSTGAQISLNGAHVSFPEDAVEQPTVVSLSSSGRIEQAGFSVFSETFALVIDNANVNGELTLVVPFVGNNERAVLFWQKNGDTSYRRITGTAIDGRLTASIDGAGSGFVGDGVDFVRPPDRGCLRLSTRLGQVVQPGLVGLLVRATDCAGNPHPELTPTDFSLTENGVPIPAFDYRDPLTNDAHQTLVTVLVNLSNSMAPDLPLLQAAIIDFVLSLQVENPRSVHIGLRVFGGGDATDPNAVIHSTVWQPHTLDTDTLIKRINELDQYVAPQPELTNLNGAIVQSLTALGAAAQRIRQRHRGGALTSTNLVIITDSIDTAGHTPIEDVVSAIAGQRGTVVALAIARDNLDPPSLSELVTDWFLAATETTSIRRELAA